MKAVFAERRYDKSPAEVFEGLADQDQVRRRLEALAPGAVERIECDRDADRCRITAQRQMQLEPPGALRRLVRRTVTALRTDEWRWSGDGSLRGSMRLSPRNVPVEIAGTMRLSPVEGGSLHAVDLRISCAVPVVGRRLAEFAAPKVRAMIERELELIAAA